MNISCECVSCVISSAMELMAKQLPGDKHQQITAQMLEHAARQDWQESPPEFARKLYTLLRDSGGESDSFCEAKKLSTALALQLLPESARGAAKQEFQAAAGSLLCREIKVTAAISCAGCVETAAGIVEKYR